ncbi:MAG: gamma-glutamyltransferase [Thiotrichales bacterium]|nr:MAG: gamma-glutamyltransferase [Thiotrichales bacterium]
MKALWRKQVFDLVRPVLLALALSVSFQASSDSSAVASAHPLATDAGIDILKKGGNAFDAAVAVTATLAVVEPYSSGIGGGGFWLLHIEQDHRDVMIDGRERAPLAASRDMYLDDNNEVIPGASIDGALSAGIPGVPAAIEHIALNYGKLPLTVTLEPAIRHARTGFKTDKHYQRMAVFREKALNASPEAAKIFLKNNKAPEPGTLIIQSDLADTLSILAAQGARGFYQGELASKLVTSVVKNGGIWSKEDLASYRIIERTPVSGNYRGMKVISAAPPSSGGVALIQMLNMLAQFDFDSLSQSGRTHLLTEVMRRAYRDRAEYLGDTDFVDVPVDRLISEKHAKTLADSVRLDRATPSDQLRKVAVDANKATDTTHFSVVDKEGNRVAATLSINYPFGSGFVAEATGVLLNDEMDDFSSKPGVPNVYGLVGNEANAIEPGKRMLSSMTPTFLETEERIAVLGTPGGSRIITMVLLAALEFHRGGSADSMVNLGRFHHQYLPDRIFIEPDVFSESLVTALFELGHETSVLDSTFGNMHAIVFDRKRMKLDAAADSRGGGTAAVLH